MASSWYKIPKNYSIFSEQKRAVADIGSVNIDARKKKVLLQINVLNKTGNTLENVW